MGIGVHRSNTFFKYSIILFGFLNGVWIAIGIDPEKIISGVLQPFVEQLGSQAVFLFGILPTLLLCLSLYLIYNKGKVLGLGAVFLGFLGGILVLVSPLVAGLLLIAAWILGYLAIS